MNHQSYPDPHHEVYSKTVFGFWVYLLTDFVMFATFFAAYAVLYTNTYGSGPPKEVFKLCFAFEETLILLSASFTAGLGNIFAHKKEKNGTLLFYGLSFILGALFLQKEWVELSSLLGKGFCWDSSAFFSAFYTLLGMHALHMCFALLWVIVLLIPVLLKGLTLESVKRLTCLRLFFQFITLIWVLIFSLIYLLGAYS